MHADAPMPGHKSPWLSVAAFIPARSGSKRVPGKNLRDVGGVSLLVRAIRSAECCQRIVVSGDGADVLDAVAEYNGMTPRVEWHERPAHAATDHAQIESAIAAWWRDQTDKPDAVVLLQPTSPFRTAEHVSSAIGLLDASGADCVVGVSVGHEHHFAGRLKPRDGVPRMQDGREHWRCWNPPRLGWAALTGKPHNGPVEPYSMFVDFQPFRDVTAARPRTQDLRPMGAENGALYAFTREHWERTGNRMGGHMVALPMTRWDGLDVDDEDDLRVANALVAGGVCK